jgi:hypothetical protein
MDYATVAHKCCCGCGQEVVTPLSPTDWKLTYDGASISLSPSIGNWSFACQSHYWIEKSTVKWADNWSKDRIDAGRSRDRFVKEEHFKTEQLPRNDAAAQTAGSQRRERGILSRILKWWKS